MLQYIFGVHLQNNADSGHLKPITPTDDVWWQKRVDDLEGEYDATDFAEMAGLLHWIKNEVPQQRVLAKNVKDIDPDQFEVVKGKADAAIEKVNKLEQDLAAQTKWNQDLAAIVQAQRARNSEKQKGRGIQWGAVETKCTAAGRKSTSISLASDENHQVWGLNMPSFQA